MKKTWKTEDTMPQFCSPGVRKEKDGIRFTTEVPAGTAAFLQLYQKETGELEAEVPFPDAYVCGSFKTLKVLDLDWKAYRYNYRLDQQILTDSYAVSIWKDCNGVRQCELHFEKFSWGKSHRPEIPFEDGILYHLHVRNYTMHEKSGVLHKGTFLGLKEKLPYLKKLGVNQILLMPAYEFEEEEHEHAVLSETDPVLTRQIARKNYWGYKQGFYFAPKRRFAATEDPVREFKSVIRAFHEQQMEILMEFYFTEQTELRKQIAILQYWVEEFQIDGFRIMGNTELAGYLANDPLFSNVKILAPYFEPEKIRIQKAWQTAPAVSGKKDAQKRNLAEINDGFSVDMRRILKGDEGALEQMAFRTVRNPEHCAVINYITAHDGFTLQDLVSYDQRHNEENGEENRDGCPYNYSWNCGAEGETNKRSVLSLRTKLKKNAMLLLLCSQGTPMLLAGDEFGNSQQGNNNPYCLDNPVSWVDWGAYQKNRSFVNFVKQCIALRKSEPLLRRNRAYSFADQKGCGYPDLSYHSSKAWYADFGYPQRTLGMLYCGSYVQESHFLYVCYNLHPQEQELALPRLPEHMKWYKKADSSQKESMMLCPEELHGKEKTIRIMPRTIMLFIGKQEE